MSSTEDIENNMNKIYFFINVILQFFSYGLNNVMT